MHVIVGSMMVVFALSGLWLIWGGLKYTVQMRQNYGRMTAVEGTIVRLHTEARYRKRQKRGREMRLPVKINFPVIEFLTHQSERVEFRWHSGDEGDVSRYQPGQKLPVRYDPRGEVEPLVDTWWGIWGVGAAQAAGGLAFVGGAGLIWYVFGQRILAGFGLAI